MEVFKISNLLISLKESESLIFNKIVSIPISRLSDIKIRSRDFSVNLKLNNSQIFLHQSYIIIFSSAIKSFEIVPHDLNLFRNHYKVPIGLLETSKGKVRDVKKGTSRNATTGSLGFLGEQENSDFHLNDYMLLRNALFSSFLSALNSESIFKVFKEFSSFIINDEIVFKTLHPHIKNSDIIKIHKEGNYSIAIERFLGVLLSVRDALKDSETDLDKAILAKWLKTVLESSPKDAADFLEKIILCDINFPRDWEGYKSFFYFITYFAFGKENLIEENKGFPLKIAEKVSIDTAEAQFWNSFFLGMFSEKVTNIYLIESLREWQFFIELIVFCKVNSIQFRNLLQDSFEHLLIKPFPFLVHPDTEEALSLIANEYYRLSINNKATNVKIISELNEVFKDIPSDSKRKINTNKPVIIGFAKDFEIQPLFKSILISSSQNSKTRSIVVVNEVVNTEEDIFSLEFERLLNDFKREIALHTDIKIEVLIAKHGNINPKDLIRNLKNIFKENNVKKREDVFVVDYKLNEKIARCIVSALPATLFWDGDSKFHFFSS